MTDELFDKVIALDECMFDINEDDVEQHVSSLPFDSSCYIDGDKVSLYMTSPLFPPRNHVKKIHVSISPS